LSIANHDALNNRMPMRRGWKPSVQKRWVLDDKSTCET
jgi:hypothetical protein